MRLSQVCAVAVVCLAASAAGGQYRRLLVAHSDDVWDVGVE